MAIQVNMHEAKSTLSKLVEQVNDGEEVVIARAGRPVAKLVKYESPRRRLGALDGKMWIADDFDEPDEALIALFYGDDEEPA